MNKKKDKFVTTGKSIRLKNTCVNDLDDIYDFEEKEQSHTKTFRRTYEKGKFSQKSNLTLLEGRIIEMRTNYSYIVDMNGALFPCTLSGRLKYLEFESHNPVCVGDYVKIDTHEKDNYRIEEVLPRHNRLSRYLSSATMQREIAIVSNIDQIIITVSCKDPMFNSGLIDRYLCLAEIYQIHSLICVNKTDIADDLEAIQEECQYYLQNGYQVIYTSTQRKKHSLDYHRLMSKHLLFKNYQIKGSFQQYRNPGIEELKELLKNKDSVFTGHSGTGKSSIINAIEPSLNLRVGEVSNVHRKGQHTTTTSRMIKWSFGGHLIDTPGIKTLELSSAHKNLIPSHFPGFGQYASHCYFQDCTHTHEDHCSVLEHLGKEIPEERYDSYIRIMDSL